MPMPIQISETAKQVIILYEGFHAFRVISRAMVASIPTTSTLDLADGRGNYS